MLTGSIVALVTPMLANGEIDYPALKKLVDFHCINKTAAIVIAGTTGESATINEQEYIELLTKALEFANNRIPIWAGSGTNCTKTTIAKTKLAKELGASACLIVTPYYNKPPQHGLLEHYLAIANTVDIQQILYNVPSRTGCDLLPETVTELANHNNIVGIKEAYGTLERYKQLVSFCPKEFAIYSGEDTTFLDLLFNGGHGVISVTANVIPLKVANICNKALKGEEIEAKLLFSDLALLNRNLFIETNPIAVKWVLFKMGLIDKGIRLPLTKLAEKYHEDILNSLQDLGIVL